LSCQHGVCTTRRAGGVLCGVGTAAGGAFMRVRIAVIGACLLALATCTDDHTPTSPRPPRLAAAVTGGDPVFIGAGDIAECDSHSYATDSLIDTMPGTIFTAGENAYTYG